MDFFLCFLLFSNAIIVVILLLYEQNQLHLNFLAYFIYLNFHNDINLFLNFDMYFLLWNLFIVYKFIDPFSYYYIINSLKFMIFTKMAF